MLENWKQVASIPSLCDAPVNGVVVKRTFSARESDVIRVFDEYEQRIALEGIVGVCNVVTACVTSRIRVRGRHQRP
jgi:hypothetical protein